ncbi:response regulator transcription factor [Macrococcus epidermidis]|uniref:response regulator transcription factor n=1 Tax=Macrococcus epidermidis TaxID=1902580 RepID=UPI0020B883D8|nr:response regulator transcription factor [Macrococcus epidermidis]UTH16275.1 response regulator transcription factor [Macrococcus epidermidis]
MNNIIYVEDDKNISKVVSEYLGHFGYKTTVVDSFNNFQRYRNTKYDLILLDIMLPEISGIEICKNIRNLTTCPIIFISALSLEDDIISALECGGDDYITKPFSLKQLKTKIDIHLRREKRNNSTISERLITGNLIIDTRRKEILINNQLCDFTKKEYLLIEKLVRNKYCAVSKEKLFETIWGYNNDSNINTVTEHIKKIRKKLSESDPTTSYIQTKYGFGYFWEEKSER